MRLLQSLASLKLTLVGIVLLGAASVAIYQLEHAASAWLAGPLLLLATNLTAAVVTNGVFRRQVPLLAFHLTLIALVLLAAIGRLSYLKGAAEVVVGGTFNGLTKREAGPFHAGRLDRVSFVNDGFDISYKPGPIRDKTVNRVRWVDEQGRAQSGEIGDNRPLVLHGYRFYSTFNKGFAPLLVWHPAGGAPMLGAVHLPSYPANENAQARDWPLPGSTEKIWVMLDFDEVLISPDQPSHFRLPQDHKLVLRHGDRRWELRTGDRVDLPGGSVEYHGLETWMGYTVFYDWTIPWLLATCLMAVLSLAWHFWRKFAARPWNPHGA